jgi:UDP-glucose 4-epimerase
MKNYIIVTGGAGFVASNLIEHLLIKTNKIIISLDNYTSGSKKNHIINKRVKYLRGNTADINNFFLKYKKQIHSLFHFGEFSRIFQSFKKFNECFQANSIGTQAVFKFCLEIELN